MKSAGTFLSLIILGFFLFSSSASAATIYANYSTGNDTTGDGSFIAPYKTFHKAYTMAASNDTIDLNGTFTWTNADETGDAVTTGYTISKNLIITGQSATSTIIQAATASTTADRRVFTIDSTASTTFQNLTIRHGRLTSGASSEGGGILNSGTTTIDRVHVRENYVQVSTSGTGGGINNKGTLTVRNSAILYNHALSQGGGIASSFTGTQGTRPTVMYIVNTTIAYNTQTSSSATVGGPGIFAREGTVYVLNSSIVENNQLSSNTSYAPAVNTGGGTVHLKNTIVANNKQQGTYLRGISGAYDVSGITDAGNNIISKVSSTSGLNTNTWYDQSSTGAGDDVYRKVGSASPTGGLNLDSTFNTDIGAFTLLSGSIAINNSTTTALASIEVPTTDQSRVVRDGLPDIGAMELISDSTPPITTNVSSDKANGSYSIGEVIDIDVTFSEVVTSTGNVTVTLETGTTDRTCTFTVTASTTGTCNYTVQAGDTTNDLTVSTISGTITDSNSNAMVNFVPTTNLANNKALVIDTTEPLMSTVSPVDNATNVSVNANLIITFDEVVVVGTGSIVIQKVSDSSIIESIDVTGGQVTGSGTDTITINPSVVLDGTTEYFILVPAVSFQDAATNSFAGIGDPTAWTFTTADIGNPAVISLSPLNGATDIDRDTNLTITFDEVVDVEIGNITIKKSSDDSTVETIDVTSGQVTGTGTEIIIINPSVTLASSMEYYIQIDATAFDDISSNSFAGILDTTTWSFTTDAVPVIEHATPIDTSTDIPVNTHLVIDFSEPMDPDSFVITTSPCFESCMTYNIFWAEGEEQVTFGPATDFEANTTYTLTVSINDAGGTPLEDEYVWSFTTVEVEEEEVVEESPQRRSSGFSVRSRVKNLIDMGNIEMANALMNQFPNQFENQKSVLVTVSNEVNPATNTKFVFNKNLRPQETDPDVLELQKFLNANGFIIKASGPGSNGFETSHFGTLTQIALKKFQETNSIFPATGFFGPKTREFIANMNAKTSKVTPVVVHTENNVTEPVVTPTETPIIPQIVRDLEVGMEDTDVTALQKLLIARGYSIPAGVTGFFGGQTREALVKYQSENGIVPAIGYFGIATRTQMKSAGILGLWW